MKWYRIVWTAALLPVIVLSASGNGPAAAAPLPQEGLQTVVNAITSEPTTLDPTLAAGSAGDSRPLSMLYDTLVFRNIDLTYSPYLAESWEVSDDGRTITFKLKEGVTFHDGDPFNADSVIFSLNRFLEVGGARSPLYGEIQRITHMEKISDYELAISFEEPSATFIGALSQPYAAMLSPSAVAEWGEDYGRHPVGTGAFKLKEWKSGQTLVFERNPDYNWGPPPVENKGPAYVDEVVYKVMPDPSTQIAALQAGQVDMAYVNTPSLVRQVADDPNIVLHDSEASGLYYLAFNMSRPPLDELKVRQALSHAIDKDVLVEIALEALGERACYFLPPDLPGSSPELQRFELTYDVDRARELLAEAGYETGADGLAYRDGKPLQLLLLTSTRKVNEAMATLLQAEMLAIGVDVRIQQMESASAIEAANAGEHDVLLWRYSWTDPDALYMWLSTDRIGNGNRAFYSNPEVDELLRQGQVEMDQDARNTLYVRAQELIFADAPWQPLASPKNKLAVSKRIKGLGLASQGRILYNDITIE